MNHSGIVLHADLDSEERRAAFRDMEQFAASFMRDYGSWWPEVPWPPDALHQWSRQFEYPFAFHHLRGKSILDAGSGITFFPFFLAAHGFEVMCVDPDPALTSAFQRVNARVRAKVIFHQGDLMRLPFADASFDSVICVSVLEHLTDDRQRATALRELGRVLRPGGRAVVTLDVNLDGSALNIYRFDHPETLDGLCMLNWREALPDCECWLTTNSYKDTPQWLPWSHLPQRPWTRRVAVWMWRRLLRRRKFKPLGLAAIVYQKEGPDSRVGHSQPPEG